MYKMSIVAVRRLYWVGVRSRVEYFSIQKSCITLQSFHRNFSSFRDDSKPIMSPDEKKIDDIMRQSSSESIAIGSITQQSGLTKDQVKDALKQLSGQGLVFNCKDSADALVRDHVIISVDVLKERVEHALGRSIPQVLEKELIDLRKQIQPFRSQLNEIDKRSQRVANMMARLGLGALCAQFGVIIYLTYFELGWDQVEPMTWLLGQSVILSGYAYFLFFKSEQSYAGMWNQTRAAYRNSLIKSNGLDLEKIVQLENEIAQRESKLSAQSVHAH
mmetsp:Transcript_1690/g.2994  ORF Transcript_1690/g.2994 Transcript_1690/m.2994 type:complete len:274 (-) Transcript_1690:262-1083(-)